MVANFLHISIEKKFQTIWAIRSRVTQVYKKTVALDGRVSEVAVAVAVSAVLAVVSAVEVVVALAAARLQTQSANRTSNSLTEGQYLND